MIDNDTDNQNAENNNTDIDNDNSATINVNQVSDAELDNFIMGQHAQSSDDEDNENDYLQNVDNSADDNEDEEDADLGSDDNADDPDGDDAEEDDDQDLDSDDDNDDGEIDYKAFHDELFAPIKANGREVTISNVDEARRLMQQGLGYNKNMKELKPFKKAMNLLKKREALDPEKLNFLLDVSEGKPEAIAKLLKDTNIQPIDIDMEGDEYKSTYEDTEALDTFNEILESIESSEAKVQTLEILSSGGWDKQSKEILYAQPQNILRLHAQIQDGAYAKIMGEVVKRQALGELAGVSDLEAYNLVGTELTEQGKLGVPNTPNGSNSSSKQKKQSNNQAQKQKRKKASGAPRRAASNQLSADTFNPATASEEELDAFIQSHLKKAASEN